ncbi:Chromatin remodeling protein EBS-like protein [Drosera capensis]
MAKTKPGKKDLDSYTIKGTNKVVRRMDSISSGDTVMMRPSDSDKPPYVARVEKIEADHRNNVKVHVRWYYRPEESLGGRRQFHGAKELFLSDHYDIQSAHTIEGKCTVHSFKNYTKLEDVGADDYFCRFEYKAATGGFTPDRVAVYCKCEMPYNPDDLMVQCERCKDWFHPSCMEMTIEEAKKLEHFSCTDCSSEDDAKRSMNSFPVSPSMEAKVEPKRRKRFICAKTTVFNGAKDNGLDEQDRFLYYLRRNYDVEEDQMPRESSGNNHANPKPSADENGHAHRQLLVLSIASLAGIGIEIETETTTSPIRLRGRLTVFSFQNSIAAEPPEVVSSVPGLFSQSQLAGKAIDKFDVLVCGGTLGIFIAAALGAKGLKVGVVERNVLKGREQKWNISRVDVDFKGRVRFGLKTSLILEFRKLTLNLGIKKMPVKLIEIMKERFNSLGRVILESESVSSICIYEDAAVTFQAFPSSVMLVYLWISTVCFSRIRRGRKPDGVCLVVGSCPRGFKNNDSSDVIYSSSTVKKIGASEAFPVGSGPMDRTTYMFTYVDPKPGRPKLEDLLELYWELMPSYQGVVLEDLEIMRVVYGIFPTYRDRQVQTAVYVLETVKTEAIISLEFFVESFPMLYVFMWQPNLSSSWLFQRAMSAKQQAGVSPDFITELLHVNFQSMEKLGDPVLRPFLQDVIKFVPLVKTLGLVMLTKPHIIPSIFKQVGFCSTV